MMIDARIAPKVGSISPFGATVCNVNHINAKPQLLPEAGAAQEWTLEVVSCRQLFDGDLGQQQLLNVGLSALKSSSNFTY
jgi:hypothetical protein